MGITFASGSLLRPYTLSSSPSVNHGLDDLYLIELFISIIPLRTLKGGWCFGLTFSELHFLPESTSLDICLDLFREQFKRSHHFALHGKEASVPTSLSVNCTFCLSPPFLFQTSHDADNEDLSSFQQEWTQQHIRTRPAGQFILYHRLYQDDCMYTYEFE